MTTEEKARKFDEALERARQFSEHPLLEDSANIVEYLFPELKESEDERIRKEIISALKYANHKGVYNKHLVWLEMQGTKKKQLYVRFGDIPSNEKSKIYRGEEEIGDENGVSVYPAFELNGNIVLGLTLPITKTTLYTQQHLLEYDNRPCYLVSGDYVGNGTDGEPLLRNISIIKRLYNYRIKELEKQKKQSDTNNGLLDKFTDEDYRNMFRACNIPKFSEGDWIINNDVYGDVPVKIKEIGNYLYLCERQDGVIIELNKDDVFKEYKHWDITDAVDGNVLVCPKYAGDIIPNIFIFKDIKVKDNDVFCYCSFSKTFMTEGYVANADPINTDFYPATKEQCDLLFQKMKEAGYEWDWWKKRIEYINDKYVRYEDKVYNNQEQLFKHYKEKQSSFLNNI